MENKAKRETTHLQRGTSENQPIPRRIILIQRLTQFTIHILHPVTFIDNHVDPLDLGEQQPFLNNVLVRRQTHLEIDGADTGVDVFTLRGRAFENGRTDPGRPSFEFHRPIGQGGQGDNDEERAGLAFLFDEVGDERDGLDGLAETLCS